jgi:multisubunit Na+/H+ antiporter MnhB subunit
MVGPSSAENPTETARQRNFENVLGVSEAELRARGVDPDDYAAAHIHDALKDPKVRALILPQSMDRRLASDRRAVGAYVAIFVGFGFLFLSLARPLHWFGIVAGGVSEVIAVTMFVVGMRYRRQARTLRRDQPSPLDELGRT